MRPKIAVVLGCVHLFAVIHGSECRAGAAEAPTRIDRPSDSSALHRIARLKFNGFFIWQGQRRFSFSDPVMGGEYWLTFDQAKSGLKVTGFDRTKLTVRVALGGAERNINLQKDNIVPLLTIHERRRREEQAVQQVAQDMAVGFLLHRERSEKLAEQRRANER